MTLFKQHGKHAPGNQRDEEAKADADEQAQDSGSDDELAEAEDEKAHDSTEAGTPYEGDAGYSDAGEGEDEAGRHARPDLALPELDVAGSGDEDALGFVSAAPFGDIPSKKRRTGVKAVLITLGVLVVLAAIAYVVGANVFNTRFVANTVIDGNDISFKTDEEVEKLLDSTVSGYRLDISSTATNGFTYRITSKDIGLTIDSESVVAAMHDDLDAWQWPLLMLQMTHDESDRVVVGFSPDTYAAALDEAVAAYNETATAPVDATIVYDEETGGFVVKPEVAGTQYDPAIVQEKAREAIAALDTKMTLDDTALIQPSVFSTDEKLIEAAEIATGMVSADLTLVMEGQTVGEVNGDTLSDFVSIGEDYEVVFLEEEMTDWLDELTSGYNTVGTARYFTRADGKEVSVPARGSYGWKIDTEALTEEIIEGVREGAVDTIEVPCSSTAATYNGPGERDWGNRYIDVDISEQYVRFYGDDGSIIWESDCVSGLPNGKRDTVPGTWKVNAKQSPSTLVGYENGEKTYETEVTYWMPFEGNSIGFHDANWQASFGGSRYQSHGSHGCVNLPYSAAQSLYDIIQVGDVVVVHS